MTTVNNTPSIERTLAAQIKVYYELHLPELQPGPLLIALHGYGASKRQMMHEARLLAPTEFAIASVQGPHQHLKEPRESGGPLRFGFGWLTNFHPEESIQLHHQVLLELIDSLVGDQIANSQQLYLLGFSQSCALNYRFAFTYPERLRGVVGICGGLPGDWETSKAYQPTSANIFHLAGEEDEFYPPERVQDFPNQLKLRARNVEFKSYKSGHEIAPEMREDVARWLKKLSQAAKS